MFMYILLGLAAFAILDDLAHRLPTGLPKGRDIPDKFYGEDDK